MATEPNAQTLIAGEYAIDFAQPLPGAGGGLPSFAARDRRGRRDFMAVETRPWQPARADALSALLSHPIEGVLSPVAHGPAKPPSGPEGYFVIAQAPTAPSLAAAARPWSEGELLEQLLRPAVRTLERLHQRGVTHRAIRPDNLFEGIRGQPAVLGCAWASPPASLQPALFEPPYVAMCLPNARGNGSAADDVYALGVTLLALALGRLPLAELDERALIWRKLEQGSFRALAGEERLPGMIADLVRGMLAEDPEHRPPLALLADPAAARSRRVAARPPRRAQRPFDFPGHTIWDARALSFAISCEPVAGLAALRDGSAERWVRRSLGEPALATRIADRVAAAKVDGASGPADLALLVQAASILDPLAPLCWPGATIWPDALGAAFAAAQIGPAGQADAIEAVVDTEAARLWANEREDRCDLALVRTEARQQRAALRTRADGKLRLLYLLNPLLACGSPALSGRCVVRIVDLLPALEAAAVAGAPRSHSLPVDGHVAAFAAVRGEGPGEAVLSAGPGAPLAQLRMLARLQARFHHAPLPAIGKWLAAHAPTLLSAWRNKARRQQLETELQGRAETGQLGAMLALLEDKTAHAADAAGAARATDVLAAANAELQRIDASSAEQTELARRLGQEIAAGSGLAALVAALAFAAFG